MELKKIYKPGDMPSAEHVNMGVAAYSEIAKGSKTVLKDSVGGSKSKNNYITIVSDHTSVIEAFTPVIITGVYYPDIDSEDGKFPDEIACTVVPYDTEESTVDHGQNMAVLQDSVEPGRYGVALMEGLSLVWVDVKDVDDEFADFNADEENEEKATPVSGGDGVFAFMKRAEDTGKQLVPCSFPTYQTGGFLIKNDTEEIIPPFSAAQVTGDVDEDNPRVRLVGKPQNPSGFGCYSVGKKPLAAGKKRRIDPSKEIVFRLSANSVANPKFGTHCGTLTDEWEVTTKSTGFIIQYELPPGENGERYVMVEPAHLPTIFNRHSAGTDEGTINSAIYSTNPAGEQIIEGVSILVVRALDE